MFKRFSKKEKDFNIISKEANGSKTTYIVTNKGYSSTIKARIVLTDNKVLEYVVLEQNDSFYKSITNNDYLNTLINGVLNNIDDIDKSIEKYIESWSIDRLGLTDQAILRISVYELLYTNTPNLVCINEAIELSKKYSDEKVSKMINGVLDKIYHEVEDKSE